MEPSMDEALLKKLREVVEANLGNEQFSVEDLAEAVAYSRSHLHRKLSQLTGRSISQYIRSIRLEHGMELLKGDVATVSEIAFRVGFGSSTYFIKCFNDEYGFSPGEVKKKLFEGWFNESKQEEPILPVNKFQPGKPVVTPLETLHPSTSESLIREVFEALVEFRPSLGKYLLVDEDEGESVDMRLLAYEIIKNYPWPLGVELRRLFSASMKSQGAQRYEQIQKTIFRTLKLLAFILTGELVSLLHGEAIKPDLKILSSCSTLLEKLDEENLLPYLEKVTLILKSETHQLFIEEFSSVFNKGFFLELKSWREINKDLEEQENGADYAVINTSLEQVLITLLKKSAFLAKYRMVSVSSIRVQKSLFKEARFEHHLHLLNSSDSDFRLHQEIAEKFSDSHAVVLLKSVKRADEFLNLSPMMVDTFREEGHLPDRSGIKRDIFLLDAFKEGNLAYAGTEFPGVEDLSELENYEELLESFNRITQLMKR